MRINAVININDENKHTIFFISVKVVRIDLFWFILKVANIRCFILIKCSEQGARFIIYVIMS